MTEDLEKAEKKINYALKTLDRVVIRYFPKQPSI